MDQIQSNHVKMYKSSSSYLHDHPDQLNSIPRFAEALGEFDANLALINSQEVHRNTTSEGKTEVKHNVEELIYAAIDVVSSLRAYAAKQNLTELKSIVKISVRKLVRLKELDLITKCTQIFDEAIKLAGELGNYGISRNELTILKNKIEEFKAAGGKRDSSVADRKGTRINILELMSVQNELLEDQLDSFVNKFIQKDKLFYDGYYAARQIKEYGVRHEKKEENNAANNPSVPAV